jgi:outer membrane cobalamin receptor
VEIVRGPGSAIYGGCAEYAVINIITKKGEDIKGLTANAAIGQTAKTYTHQNVGLAIGNKKNDFAYSVSGMIGRGQRSDKMYTDILGSSYDMVGNSGLNPTQLNAAVSYKGLSLQFYYDDYRTSNRDNAIPIMSRTYPLDFLTCMTQLRYEKRVNKKLLLDVTFNHKYANPWTFRGQPDPVDSDYTSYVLNANRYKGRVNVLWDPVYWLNVNAGMESYADYGHLTGGQVFRKDSTSDVSYMNYAPYAQLLIRSRIANVTVGARYDINNAFGSAFNPRLGVTRRVGMFNFKLLYASSFRAPALESIQYAIDKTQLKPEQSHTVEFEASAQLTKKMYLSVNCFDITTSNAIRYFVKTDSVITGFPDGYTNSKVTTGSQGIELEYKYISGFGFIDLSYAYYTVLNKNVDPANEVPTFRAMTLGNARHKVTLTSSINVGKHVYVSPSMNLLGRRYGYAAIDTAGNGVIQYYKPQTTINIFVGSNSLIKNCSFGIGVNNLLNENILYLQAYNSLHAPLPGMSREYFLRMSYRLPFKQRS